MENYEKKYKEAIKRAVKLRDDLLKNGTTATAKGVEYIFPELAESEDERIKTFIRGLLLPHIADSHIEGDRIVYNKDIDNYRKALAWLEKQGEQKPADNEMIEILHADYEKGRADAIEEMQDWSEEDENMRGNLLGYLNGFSVSETAKHQMFDWLKSIRPQKIMKEQLPHWKKCTLPNVPWGLNSDYLTCPDGYYIELKELLKLPKDE